MTGGNTNHYTTADPVVDEFQGNVVAQRHVTPWQGTPPSASAASMVLSPTKHADHLSECSLIQSSHEMTPAGLEPAIPGSVGRCLIHWATGPMSKLSQKLSPIRLNSSPTATAAPRPYVTPTGKEDGALHGAPVHRRAFEGDAREDASAGDRTRVTSMATMFSTTRPLMLEIYSHG